MRHPSPAPKARQSGATGALPVRNRRNRCASLALIPGIDPRVRLDFAPPLAYLGAIMAAKSDPNSKLIAENRRARFDYAIESDIEAGIILQGSEVKSLRQGGANIAESYASVEGGELWLINRYIAPYLQAKTWGHEARRRRKLLVSRKELSRLWNATAREGMTIVPIAMYFNDRGIVKLKLGVAKGKKLADKRATEAKRDWDREKSRLLKQSHH